MRFVFTPPADHAAGLITLPWSEPLADWRDERLVEIRQRGISRHVVRFVYDDGILYALKELSERLARREYRLLRALAELGIPAVEVVGAAGDRRGARTPVRVAVAGADPRGDPQARGAALPDRRAPAPAQRARLRRGRGRAGQHRRRQQAAAEDPGRGDGARLEEAVPAHRDRRRRASGAAPAQRHGRVPGLAGAETGTAGIRGGGGQPVDGGGLRP